MASAAVDLAQPLLESSPVGTAPPPGEVFHAVYAAPACDVYSRARENSATKSPTVIHLDLEAGACLEKKERESRREVKRSLVALTMALGLLVGSLINLAGFGGENLFMILLRMRHNIDVFESCRAKIFTVVFWGCFTMLSLFAIRSIVLTMLEKILQNLYADHKLKYPHGTVKSAENEKNFTWATWICGGDTDEEDHVTLSLDYLDDKFLLSTLIGSSLIGVITNVWAGSYYPGIGEMLGTIAVIGIDKCLMRKKKKRFYEKGSV